MAPIYVWHYEVYCELSLISELIFKKHGRRALKEGIGRGWIWREQQDMFCRQTDRPICGHYTRSQTEHQNRGHRPSNAFVFSLGFYQRNQVAVKKKIEIDFWQFRFRSNCSEKYEYPTMTLNLMCSLYLKYSQKCKICCGQDLPSRPPLPLVSQGPLSAQPDSRDLEKLLANSLAFFSKEICDVCYLLFLSCASVLTASYGA